MTKKRGGRKKVARRGPRRESPLRHSPSAIYEDLSDAICLLKLIDDREPETEQIGSRNLSGNAESTGYDRERDEDGDQVEVELAGLEELDTIDRNNDDRKYILELRDKLLDRLAETLARFKSDPGRKMHQMDADHVSSTIMILCEKKMETIIICTKNNALDKDDEDFLAQWMVLMECISNSGMADPHQYHRICLLTMRDF
jgi:hypothetical protein